MSPIIETLSLWSRYEVHTLRWLEARGLSQTQAFRSSKIGDLKKIGAGVYVRAHDPLHWAGAIQAIQQEVGLPIHIGGITALELKGSGHNVSSVPKKIQLISFAKPNLPRWLLENDWNTEFQLHRSSLFESVQWFELIKIDGLEIEISSRELSILEYIDQSRYEYSFSSTENYLQGLMTLRPAVVQGLLEVCRSIKVKRIFLYLSEKLNMPYFKSLDLSKVDLGSGKRVIIKNGRLNHKYQITVEAEEEENPF